MATISIVGMQGSGKSFLMNQLLGIENAFKVNEQTKIRNNDILNVVQVFSEPI